RVAALHQLGQHARAEAAAAEGLRRFPLDSGLIWWRGWELVDQGRREDAARLVDRGSPTGSWLAALVAQGMVMRGPADDGRALAARALARPLDDSSRAARANRVTLFSLVQAWDSVRALATSLAASDTGQAKRWDLSAAAAAAAHLGDRRAALAA